MKPSDTQAHMLACVAADKVRRTWIARNSGPDVPVWSVAGAAATPGETSTLASLLVHEWITDPDTGRVSLTDQGEGALAQVQQRA